MSIIDLSQPTSAFTGAHIQNTQSEPDVSNPIVTVVNPQPAGNPSAQGIFDALKHTDRNMIFRLENKNAAGTAFLTAPELRSYAGTYAQFELDGFEIRSDGQTPATWGIYHRKSDGKDAAGIALAGYVYKNVVYGFDLEHKFAGFQSLVQAARQAKLTSTDFLKAADLSHTANQEHKKVSPMTESNALTAHEIYECTNDNGARVESNVIRVVPGSESADKTLTYDGADLSGAITAAALGPFSDAVKTKLDDNKGTIQFDTLVQRTKDIQSIAANVTSSATQDIQIQNADKFPKSDQALTGAAFNATAATMPLTIGGSTLPTSNATAPSQALAFKASIGTAATARVETVTIEDKVYGTAAVRNTQLLTLNQARFAAQTTSEAMPETTLTVAAVDTTPKTVTVKVGNTTVIDAKTYNTGVAASGSLTFRNAGSWGQAQDFGSISFTVNSPGVDNTSYGFSMKSYEYANSGGEALYFFDVTPTGGSGDTAEKLAGLLRSAITSNNNAAAMFTVSGSNGVVKVTNITQDRNMAIQMNNYVHGGTVRTHGDNLRPLCTVDSDGFFTIDDNGDLGNTNPNTVNGYTFSRVVPGTNSNLTITVQGYAAKTFTIGPVAGATASTLAGLASAVASAFDAEDGVSAVSDGSDTVTFTKTDGNFDISSNNIDDSVTIGAQTTTHTMSFTPTSNTFNVRLEISKESRYNTHGFDGELDIWADDESTIAQTIDEWITLFNNDSMTNNANYAGNVIGMVASRVGDTLTLTYSEAFKVLVKEPLTTTEHGVLVSGNSTATVDSTSTVNTNNYVAAGDYTSATALASAIQSGINAIADIHADLDPDGNGDNTIVNIRGTKKTNGSHDFTQTIPIQITQTPTTATGRCDAFLDSGAGAFPSGMTHTVFGSDLSTGSGFDYSVRITGEDNGGTVTVAANKADVDAVLNDIHTTFNTYKGNNATKWTRAEKVLLEGKFDGPADLTKKIALADSSGDISGGSAGEKLCLFDFQPVIGNKATASGDFTTAADSVSAAFKGKVKLGGFVALCAADNTVLSYLEVIPGYVVEGSGANSAKLESYDTSANPFLTKINGASAEVTVAGVANGPVVFNTNKTVGFHANDTNTIGASRIGSALIKEGVIAAFEKGSVNASGNFTQAYTSSTIRVYYADGTASANLTHDDGNNDVIQQTSAISALQFASPGADTLTIRSSHDDGNGNSSVSVTVGPDGSGVATNAATAATKFVEGFTAAKKTAGKIASVSANNNVLTFIGLSEGPDAVTFTLQKADGTALNANPLVAATTTAFACTDANHETVTLQYGTGASAKSWEKTIGKAPKYLANGNLDDQANHFLTPELAKADFYTWATTGDGSLVANITNITTVADTDARTVTISGAAASGAAPNTKSFQFTKTGDGNNNVTAATTAEIIGTEATNDITYTITATDGSGGNSTSATVRCGHSTNITKKTDNGVDSLHCNTAANIRDYIADAVCDLGVMIESKAANGANVTLSGRANGKPFAVTITAAQGGNAVDITAGNHLDVGDLVVGTNIGQITYTVASEHGIFTGDSVTLKPATHANVANNGTFNATRVSATEFSVVLTNPLSHTGFTNTKFDNNATRNVKLQFKKGNDTGTEQTIALTGTVQEVRDAIVTALDGVKDEGSKGYASAVAAKAGSTDTLVITSAAPTSYNDDQTFTIKVTDDANADAIVQDGDVAVSALGSNLFNTTVITLGAGHGMVTNDVVTVAATTGGSNDFANKVVVAADGTTISLAEAGTAQADPAGTVKAHNILDMTMANTLNLSIMDGASSKLGPANTVTTTNTAADFAPAATMKDVMQEFWTFSKTAHGLSTGDIVQQVSEAGFEVEIARGTFTKTNDDSGTIKQVKGRFQADNAFKLRQSADGTTFSDLSTTPATELVLTSTAITNATKEMFLDLEGGTQMNTQGKFKVGKYYVLNSGPQTIKAVISGANADKFGLNATALGLEKEYDFKLEAGALSVLSGPNAVADTLRSGQVDFTTESGLYEGDFGNGTSEVIQFVLSHTAATGSSNDANWGYYNDGQSPDNTTVKELAGTTQLNTGTPTDTNDYTITSQIGNNLSGSGTFASGALTVTMKNSNNDDIEFGTATFAQSSTTGKIDMTLNLDKNTFLLDNNMEFIFTLKLAATGVPAGIPTEDATAFVLYKFTNFQKPYALHSDQDFATRATWRTLSDTANASIANFHMVGETFQATNDNFYVASRTQDQLLDIDGLTWAYDNTAGAEKYTASISLSDAKSTQISNYGRLGTDIHADLKALKAGAGDSFEVPVQVDFLNKAIKGGFTKKNGDDQTLHYSDLSFTDEVRDPDSVKIHTLEVAYTAADKIDLTIKCDDVDQKALNQISDAYPANMSTNRKAPFGTSSVSGKITQLVSMDGVAIAAGNLANAANLPMTSGNFQLQIDSEGSSVALLGNSTQANIEGKKTLTVTGDIVLTNALSFGAGTQIVFQNNASSLTGRLTCTGTATDPIVFKSALDSIDDVGKGAAGREGNWKSVTLTANSNCAGCVFLGGGEGVDGTVIVSGSATMTNCAIFNSKSKSIHATGSNTLNFITIGNNATAADGSPTNLISLTSGTFVQSNGSDTDTFAAANREWFSVQNRVDMHLSYAVPGSYDLTTNADQGAGAFIFYRSSLTGGINVFRMNSSSKSSVARAVSLYNPALVTLDQAADLSFARRTALTDQTIGTLKLDGAALNLKDGSIPAGIYVYLDKENSQGTVSRNLDTGVIQLSRSATEIPAQVKVRVSNSNRGVFDVDSKDDLAAIDLTYTEDPNLEVKHHEKVVNPFRKVIEGGDYTGAIDVAGMTQVIIDGPVVLKTGASLAFDANTDVVIIERDRTVTTGVLSMLADELLASIDDNTGFAVGTYYADLSGGDGTGGKVKIVVGAGGAITSLDVTHQGSGFAAGNTLTVGTATRDEDDNNDLGKDLTITLTASDVADVYPYDMSGIIENGGEVSFGAGCVVRTNTDYQLSKANNAKVLGMVCGSTTNPTKRFYINRELVSLAVEAPTGNAADMFFVPCRMASCTAADAKNLTHANRLTDAIRLPATVDDYSCTDVALVDQALTINTTKTLRVEPGARLVGHKSIAEKIAGSAMGAKTITVTGTLQCLGFDSTNAAELHGLDVAGAGSIQLRHALITLLGDSDKIDFNTADADSFINRVEIKATASGSRAAGLNFGTNLDTRASVLEARQIKMDGAPIQVETSNLLLQDCDVLNLDSSKYGVKVTTYGSTIRKIRVNGEKLVEGATGTLLDSVQNGTFIKDVEQGIVGASEGAFENDLVIHNVAAAAFNARARLYAEKEANDNSIALTKSLTAADGFVDARADAALTAYNNERAGFGGAAISDRAAFRAAIAMEGAADYFMHVGQTYAKAVDQEVTGKTSTALTEQFLGHMILNGELLDRVKVKMTVTSGSPGTPDVFDDDSLTRTIVATTEKCKFEGTITTTAFAFSVVESGTTRVTKPILLVNGGLRDSGDPSAATNAAVEMDAFNTYASLGNQTMNYASVAATGDLGTPAKKRVLVSQSDLFTVTISEALDGTSTYKYDPYIIQSEYGRLDKGAYNVARSAGDLAYVGIFGSRGVALTANDNHVAVLHTLGNAASGTLKNTYIEDCTGHAIAGAATLNTRVECVEYSDQLCSGDITQGGAVLYADSQKEPRGSNASQFGGDVTDIQAPHQAFFTKSAGSSFGAISDANRLAHWWNPLKTFTAAYKFQGLAANNSQDIVYGYLQVDGTPAILNGGEAARLSATQIGATKFYELKKAAATAGAPKVHYKTAGSNAVEVSMAAEVTMAAAAAGTPTTQNSSDANATAKRTDRTANGDTIALQAAQLTLDNAALWGAKKQVVTATPPSGSYNELLLPANDAVEGSIQFASQKSIPVGDYTFKRIEYAVAKDLQYGAQGSMNPSPRGFTVSDTQTLTVTVEQQPKLQLFAKGAGAEAQLDTDRIRILRHSQLNLGTTDIKAIVRVNIVNPDTIANISVIDPGNAKFTASDTKVVSVAGEHAAADATGQTLVLKLNETAGDYNGASNGLTVQNVMEGEVANSEYGTQSVTVQSVTDIASVDIDGNYFDTGNNNTHLVCRNKWYDLPASNVRSIAVNVNSGGARPLAGDSRCTITATETLGNSDALTDFIGDWVWTEDPNSLTDTLTGTLSLPDQSETFGSGATHTLSGDQTFSKPVVIIEGEVTITNGGNVTVGANVDQILFKDNAKLIITGNLTISRDNLTKPVLVRHINDHTLQFCQGEFEGIEVAGTGSSIKGLMIVGGKNQLKVGGGTLGGDTAAKGIRLINGCEKALQITGELSGHCQNVYIRGAKVALEVSGTTAATELKEIRIDDCLNNALTVNSAVSLGNIFVNSPSEPRDVNMSTLMGTGAVTLLGSTTQYMGADTRKQGNLSAVGGGDIAWTAATGASEGCGQYKWRNGDPILSDVTFNFQSVLSSGESFQIWNKTNPNQLGTVADKTTLAGTLTVQSGVGVNVGAAYIKPTIDSINALGTLEDLKYYVLAVGNPVASDLANAASTPLVNFDQGAATDRMATLTTMGYVPAKDISTSAQLEYKEEYSHYYNDAGITTSVRTTTSANKTYKIQTKEYMQGLRFSATQYTATRGGGGLAVIDGDANKVHKDNTLAWAEGAMTALQLFTGTSTRAADAKTSIAKATSSSITMPTIADNPDEFDLETLAVAEKYDFARLKINATPASTNTKETKSTSYSMFSTLAVYGDTPQFNILAKDSGAETTYTGTGSNAHTWLFSGSTVTGDGACLPKVMLTFGGNIAATVKYDMVVEQGAASGRVYGIDGATILLGEVSGTFDTGSAVTINGSIDGGTPTGVINENRLATTDSPSMTLDLTGSLTKSGVSDPQVLGYTMQNEAYLSVFDAHPFGISDKRHADYAFGSSDAQIFGSASAYLEKTAPTFANDGEITVSQKASIALPNDTTTPLMDVNYTMPDAITLGATDVALTRTNRTNSLRYVRGCIRPDLHPEYTAPQAGATIDDRNYSYVFSGTQKVGTSDDNIATLNASPSIPASAALAGTADQQQYIDHIQVFGTAPAATYKGETSGLKDGFLLEFDRGLLTDLKEHPSVTAIFSKNGNDMTVSGIMAHGLNVNNFVNIVAISIAAANAGLYQVTAADANTFTFVNANGVAETGLATFEEHEDIGLQLGNTNTTLATRNLVTTLAVRPGLKYKAAFDDSGAEGVFTFHCQYFPQIANDPAKSALAGKFSMVDGLGFQCQEEPSSFQPLCTSLANHASYTGPFGGMGVMEKYTIQDYSQTMEQAPKLFQIPDQQQDYNTATGTTGTLEIQDPNTWPTSNGSHIGIKAKVRTDFCIYVQDSQNKFSLKPVNAPHDDNTNSGILVKTSNSDVELCRVGDTITDGTNSGTIEKIVVQTTGTRTIQLKMTAASTLTSSTNSSASNNTATTLSVSGGNAIFTAGQDGISWISAVTYYSHNSVSPITLNTYVMFAAADNTKGRYGLLKCTAYSSDTVTLQSEDSLNETLPQVEDLPTGTTVLFLETGSQNATLSDKAGVATFKSGHKKVTLTLAAAGSYAKGEAVAQTSTTAAGTVWQTTSSSTEVEVIVSSGTFVADAATVNGSNVTISQVSASTDMFKAIHGGGEVASKLVLMGLATHGIRINSNGVYENKGQKYMLHMRLDNKEIQVDGVFQQSFINKILVIDTTLQNPYALMRTTTVGNNSGNPQMSNVIRGTQPTPTSITMGSDTTVFTSNAYETKELNVVNVDMDAGATDANNPSHWAGNMTREKDLSGVLIVNPNDLTEHGSAFVQNAHHTRGALQFLKRPTLDTVSVTAATGGTDVVFHFTNRLALPVDAKIVITFPASFALGDVAAASSPDGSVDGSFAGVKAGQVVTITRSGGSVVAAKTACQIQVPNVTLGANSTDGFDIYLSKANGDILETDYKTRKITIS